MEENIQQQTSQTPPVEPQVMNPASQTPPEREKKSGGFPKKTLIIVVLIAALLILGLGGAYLTLGKSLMKPAPTPTPIPTVTTAPTPTSSPSATPTQAVSSKVTTSVAPTKSAGQLMLFVEFYNLNGESHAVTIKNTATGYTTSQGGTGEFNYFYALPEGHYSVTASPVEGRTLATSSPCYDCTTSSGNFNANGPDYTVYLDVKNGHTNGVYYGFNSK